MDDRSRWLMTHSYLQDRWDEVGRKLAFRAKTRRQLQAWRTKTLRKLKSLIGHDSMLKTDPKPRITEKVDCGDHIRQRLEIFTEPKILMTAYILTPKKFKPPYPAIIATHGHLSGGKEAVAGVRNIPQIAKTIDDHNYDYGAQFAKNGFIVFCPDARGFGERQELAVKGDILASSCQYINNMAIPLGQTVTGMWTWDLLRLVDYIQTRPDCISSRIGCAGLSGGGHQTLWAAALDTRIRCAIVSGYFYGYKESLLDMYTNCSCNYVPGLYENVDMGDIAALIAPRPLLIETGTKDTLNGVNGVKNVTSQMRITRKAYRIFGAEKMLAQDIFKNEHMWHGTKTIPWMKEHLFRNIKA